MIFNFFTFFDYFKVFEFFIVFFEVFTISANLERGSSEICEAKITHGGFGSEFRLVTKPEFHGHPNNEIQTSKF
jgi:hypothetical protein